MVLSAISALSRASDDQLSLLGLDLDSNSLNKEESSFIPSNSGAAVDEGSAGVFLETFLDFPAAAVFFDPLARFFLEEVAGVSSEASESISSDA